MSGPVLYGYVIPGNPKAWARAAQNYKQKQIYTSPAQKKAKRAHADYCAEAKSKREARLIEAGTPVHLFIACHFPMPKKTSITKADWRRRLSGARYHTQKPDLDNLTKLVKDALKGVAYTDDCQVATMSLSKFWTTKNEGETCVSISAPAGTML